MTFYQTLQQNNLAMETLYLGSMSGTSVDSQVDFTAAVFSPSGQPILTENKAYSLDRSLQSVLLELSTQSPEQVSVLKRQQGEALLTDFLIQTYLQFIDDLGLTDIDKNQIILSPHGQTIHHDPDHHNTDQLLQGERLAQVTGCRVVFRHRYACLPTSTAAPLAPALLQQLASSTDHIELFINGGGIANICVIEPNQSDMIAFDTGPANGPLDELIQTIVKKHPESIPDDLSPTIKKQGYDDGGHWAKRGKCNDTLFKKLMEHPYLVNTATNKSASRNQFNLDWVLSQMGPCSWQDAVTTVSTVIAHSIAQGCLDSLKTINTNCDIQIKFYGGISHNNFICDAIINLIADVFPVTVKPWNSAQLDANFIESLLMAYLGFCVHHQEPISLKHCARPEYDSPMIIPGILVKPMTVWEAS